MRLVAWFAVVFLLLSTDSPVYAAKLRSWVGPDLYFEGRLPPIRADHGFSANNDGKLYLFGGYGASGKCIE
jgi:hypothetical protein